VPTRLRVSHDSEVGRRRAGAASRSDVSVSLIEDHQARATKDVSTTFWDVYDVPKRPLKVLQVLGSREHNECACWTFLRRFGTLTKRPETSQRITGPPTFDRAAPSSVLDRLKASMSEPLDQNHVVALLRETLEGDGARIDELRRASQDQLGLAGQALGGQLTFGRATVLRILRDWRARRLTDEQVRWWALLMFAGAFPDDWTPYGWRLRQPGQPLDIDYSDDEQVNEVVSRLKDLGDFDDSGAIMADIDNMIRRLAID